jgi:hypothetical protein
LFLNEAGSAGPPLRSRASKAPPRLPDRLTSAMGDLGEAVGPAAGLSNLGNLRHSSAPLPTPCKPSHYPRSSRRAARVRSGLGSTLGIPWKSHGALSVARRRSPKHDEVKQQRSGLLCLFLKAPPGVLGGFRSEIRSLNSPHLASRSTTTMCSRGRGDFRWSEGPQTTSRSSAGVFSTESGFINRRLPIINHPVRTVTRAGLVTSAIRSILWEIT